MRDSGLTLYSTEGCHLCEEALHMLHSLHIKPQVIDIAFDDSLFLRYGVTIPVLSNVGNEIKWPFTKEQLITWLKNNGITYHT